MYQNHVSPKSHPQTPQTLESQKAEIDELKTRMTEMDELKAQMNEMQAALNALSQKNKGKKK